MIRPNSLDRITALFLTIAGLSGMIAVITGALSSHANLPPEALSRIATASQYLFYHAPAVGLCALLRPSLPLVSVLAGFLFLVGMVLFCGNLLLMGFLSSDKLSLLTPLGGIGFILGWACLAIGGARRLFHPL